MAEIKSAIWEHGKGERYFIIPLNHELISGDLNIRSFDGDVKDVDEQSILAYETDMIGVKLFMLQQVKNTLDDILPKLGNEPEPR